MSELLEQLQDAHERWCYGSSKTLFVHAKIEIESLRQRLAAAEEAAYAGWVAATGYPIAEWVFEYHPFLREYNPKAKEGGVT